MIINTKKSVHIETKPLLSIIIATLNIGNTLEHCLLSIIHQSSFDKIEILLKDGESTDTTLDVVKKYKKYIKYYSSSSDSGVYNAWNTILGKSQGKWVLFLGGDDYLYDNVVIEKSLSRLQQQNDNIDIAYGKVRIVNKNNEEILDLGKDWEHTKKCIKQKMCMPHQGVFHKRSLFETHGYFSTEYYISSDYDFIRRVITNDNSLYLNMIVSCMRIGGISTNPKNTFLRLSEIQHINRKHGSKFPDTLWIITYTNACFRHLLYIITGEKRAKIILDYFRKISGLPPFWTKI